MPGLPSSQGSTASWGGSLNGLTGITVSPRSASTFDATSVYSGQVGEADNLRIVKTYECALVDPGDATIKFIGTGFAISDVGRAQTLSLSVGGSSISGEAILESYEIDAAIGDVVRGSAKFKFTGK